tara:strand:+ start:198 stop:1238 length:1041 start_codon:yes stop_codon:yes gene_type:complete
MKYAYHPITKILSNLYENTGSIFIRDLYMSYGEFQQNYGTRWTKGGEKNNSMKWDYNIERQKSITKEICQTILDITSSDLLETLEVFEIVKSIFKKNIYTLLCSIKYICRNLYDNPDCIFLITDSIKSFYSIQFQLIHQHIIYCMDNDDRVHIQYDKCIHSIVYPMISKMCYDYKKYSNIIGWIVIPTKLGTKKGFTKAKTRIRSCRYKLEKVFKTVYKTDRYHKYKDGEIIDTFDFLISKHELKSITHKRNHDRYVRKYFNIKAIIKRIISESPDVSFVNCSYTIFHDQYGYDYTTFTTEPAYKVFRDQIKEMHILKNICKSFEIRGQIKYVIKTYNIFELHLFI